ncbi:FG-GAP-like repeat-containing protein [Streptomyces sp. 4N509B]|uniref:FG-GAP-like repeat-containing protein n=1 Tax=Streptomyces sp. 4N509B TaxID=3457413 RepID=UPI003FD27ED1
MRSRRLRPRRRVRVVAAGIGAVVLAAGGVVAVAVASPDGGSAPGQGSERAAVARDPEVRSVRLTELGRGTRGVERRGTELFSSLGISWPRAAAPLDGRAEVRTRSVETGEWSAWQPLETDLEAPETAEGAEAGARGGTAPRWVGLSDGVEARVVAEDGTVSGLPDGLRLDLVDPGTDPAGTAELLESTEETEATEATESAEAPGPAPESTVRQPTIVPRAGWGADESLVADPPQYLDRLDAVFVHHTAETNAYSCADSPAVIRSIMAYHVESLGWNDIGYNLLVDKCGTIYEGRAGGVDQPVMGAHTYGFNGYSTGVAVLGNFAEPDGVPTSRITDAVARVAGWKLGQYGVDPTGQVTLTAAGDTGVWNEGDRATLRTVSGHRDGYATECPGDALYDRLGEIRRFAASPAASAAPATSDVDGDGLTDLVTATPAQAVGGNANSGAVHVLAGGVDGPVADSRVTLTQSSPGVASLAQAGDRWGEATAYGDVNGDGHADLVVGAPGENLPGFADAGAVTVVYGPDLDSSAWLKPPTEQRAAGARFGSAVAVADVTSDGTADVFTVSRKGPSRWWVFDVANGTSYGGTLRTGASVGGAIAFPDATSADFDRDGHADVALTMRNTDGVARVATFHGSDSGLSYGKLLASRGGRSVASGDTDADGYPDLVLGQPWRSESGGNAAGQVTVVHGSASGLTGTGLVVVHQGTSGVPGANESGDAMGMSVSVGDHDLDGDADVLVGVPREDLTRADVTRSNAGTTLLLNGSRSGLTGSGARSLHQDTSGVPDSSESGDAFGTSVQLADLSGWGRADLAIGAPGESDGNGMVFQIDSGSAGLGLAGTVRYGRGTFGTPTGAGIGWSLTP